VNTFKDGDKSTGTLTSPEFEITSDVINFKIGGGAIEGEICMNLIVDGKTVRTETGSESEELDWSFWHVGELKGNKATLEIVDKATGGWGHVNVDHIMLSDEGAISGDPIVLWADYGRDFYAAVSWSDIPKEDGRRIWLGWMSNWQYANDVPTSPWRSAMTVPRTLGLTETPRGYRLTQTPVKELETIREKTASFKGGSLEDASVWLNHQGAQLIDAEFVFKGGGNVDMTIASETGEKTVIRVFNDFLYLDRSASGNVGFHKEFPGNHGTLMPRKDDGTLTVRVLIDTSSVEVFANDGESVITDLILPQAGNYKLSLKREGKRELSVQSIRFSSLKSVWKN
jgi:fructan beta-fructosidase